MIYSELKTTLADYLHRTDLGAKIPGFIAVAEAFLFRELSIRALEVAVTGTTTGALIALPSDCASVGRVTVAYAGSITTLDYGSEPRRLSAGGVPLRYTLEDGGLRLDSSAVGYAYALHYTPNLAALSDANPTNWLLTNAPDLYLVASQLEVTRYTQNTEQAAALSAALPALLDSVQRLTQRSGLPVRGGLRITPRGSR